MNDALPQRKHPAHPTPIMRHNEQIVLFVTMCLKNRRLNLAAATIQDAFVKAWGDAHAWHVGTYVIMPDHVHLFAVPGVWPPMGIKTWVRYWKSLVTENLKATETAQRELRPPEEGMELNELCGGRDSRRAVDLPKWLPDCWDTQMRDSEHYEEKLHYVRQNPVRKGLISSWEDWSYKGTLNVFAW